MKTNALKAYSKASNRMLRTAIYCSLCFLSSLHAGEWHVDRTHEKNLVTFTSEILGFSFDGKTEGIDGFIYHENSDILAMGSDFFFEVNLTDLDTGIGKRDRDMREILNTNRWPKATFAGKLGKVIQDSLDHESYVSTSEGNLILHGVEKKTVVTTKIKHQKNQMYIDAEFPLRLSEFKIQAPKLAAFIKVSENIRITVSFSMKPIVSESGSSK